MAGAMECGPSAPFGQPRSAARTIFFRRHKTAAAISLLGEMSDLNEVEEVPAVPIRASDTYYGRLIAL
jgi:hypothetical protein